MSNAIIHTHTIQPGENPTTIEIIARVIDGRVTSGMQIVVELNSSLSFSFSIAQMINLEGDQVKLILETEDSWIADLIMGLNFANERLIVSAN